MIWNTLESLCNERGWTFVGQSAAGAPDAQPGQIETMLNSYDIDYFVIFAGDLDGIVDSTKLIADEGIPVIMAALGASDDTYVTTTVGPDQEAMCAKLAEDLIAANGADAGLNIVQISGVPVQQDYILREAGFQDYINENSNYNFLGDVAYAMSSRADAKTYMENFITTYGDQIDVLMGYDDDLTMGAIQAIEEAGLTGKIQVYSVTGQVEAMEAIENGTMVETVLNRGAGIAEGCIEAIETLEAGGSVDKETLTDLVYINASNVAEYKDQAEF
jgi:ABC-type sugar transport system substrate-binding protein